MAGPPELGQCISEIFRSWAPVATLMGRVALLVGNDYPDEVGKLQHAVSDMKACEEALANIGFRCMTCENQPRSIFLETFADFLQFVRDDDDTVLFNFNGHCKLVDEKPALIFDGRGLDGSGQQASRHEMLEAVSVRLMKAKCSYNADILLLMNCCRDYGKPGTSLESTLEALNELSQVHDVHDIGRNTHGRSLTSIWACSIGCWAADTSSFRQGLLSCIGQECDFWQLHKSISINVRSHNSNMKKREGTRIPLSQRPCISSNTNSDRIDFFLPDWSRARFGQRTYPGARLKHYPAQSHRETQTSPRMVTRDHVQAPLMFIFCASLHLTVWLLFWFTRCIQLRCTGCSISDLATCLYKACSFFACLPCGSPEALTG